MWPARRKLIQAAPDVRGALEVSERRASALEAKVLGKGRWNRHNDGRPHSSLDYQTPAECAQRGFARAGAERKQPKCCASSFH